MKIRTVLPLLVGGVMFISISKSEPAHHLAEQDVRELADSALTDYQRASFFPRSIVFSAPAHAWEVRYWPKEDGWPFNDYPTVWVDDATTFVSNGELHLTSRWSESLPGAMFSLL